MLRELHIRNFSIIDDVTIEFGDGLNVLTGETGAGKSIIINALSLALGERAVGELIRSGEKEAVIEAFFDVEPAILAPDTRQFLEDSGVDLNDGLILKRIISSQGKNRAYVNTSMVNVQTLAEVSSRLIDVHGQYEHQSLLSPDNQLELLDAFGELHDHRKEAGILYDELTSVRSRIEELMMKQKERAQRLDMLRFHLNEIDSAALKPDEEEALSEESKVLGSAGRLAECANRAYAALYASDASCMERLSHIISDLREIAGIDARAKESLDSAQEALPLLEEVSYFLRDYKDSLEFNPERLDQVLGRLELIKNLSRKYGDSIQEILEYREKAAIEIDELQHSEEKLEELEAELNGLKRKLTEKAGSLSAKRQSAAKKIESGVMKELAGLSMPGSVFSVEFTHEHGDDTADGLRASRSGIDRISFLISPNPGENPKPVSKTASGGELSRIMLALKGILAKGDKIPVLVFDEIDAGIGGRAAGTVGQRLKALSSSRQLICITHLPRIASCADEHFRIEKKAVNNRTAVEIMKIEKDERTEEIARMLGGNITGTSMKHAKEMLGKKSLK